MKRYNGGTKVEGGYYFNEKSWEIVTISGKDGMLPGAAEDRFLHAPLPVLFVVAPVMGLGFAMFLPFIGFALPFYALGKRLTGATRKAAEDVAATVKPAWQPGEAYLAGKPEEPVADPKLEKEINEKRAN